MRIHQLPWKNQKRTINYFIRQKKLLTKPHEGNNFYFEMQKNDNLPLKPTQLPKTPIIKKISKDKF